MDGQGECVGPRASIEPPAEMSEYYASDRILRLDFSTFIIIHEILIS